MKVIPIKVINMTWKTIIRKQQGAESFDCGCGLDYEGMPPEHDLVHYPCDKYEKGEVCDFAIEMAKRYPEHQKKYNKEKYDKVMAHLNRK